MQNAANAAKGSKKLYKLQPWVTNHILESVFVLKNLIQKFHPNASTWSSLLQNAAVFAASNATIAAIVSCCGL